MLSLITIFTSSMMICERDTSVAQQKISDIFMNLYMPVDGIHHKNFIEFCSLLL